MKIALLGRGISYTRSGEVHGAIAQALGAELDFSVCDVTYDILGGAVKKLIAECDGFFVTQPYKKDVGRYLPAASGGAINVVRSRDRSAINTDGDGFILAMNRVFPEWKDKVGGAVVLGAGGAAFAVCSALKREGKRVFVLDRTLKNALRLSSETGAELYYNDPAELIVNCTCVGRDGGDILRMLCVQPLFDYAFDLTYGERTQFMNRCASSGGRVSGGDGMLIYQAILGDAFIFGNIDAEKTYDRVMKILGE